MSAEKQANSNESDYRQSPNQEQQNASSYEFKIFGCENAITAVFDFESRNHAISSDYELTITIKASKLEYDKVIGKNTLLTMKWGDTDNIYMHGIVTNISLVKKVKDQENAFIYVVNVASPITVLRYTRQNKVFLKKTVIEIIEDVLKANNLSNSLFEFKTKAQYQPREIVVQYDESDFEFISRLMSYHGIFFFFTQTKETAMLVLHDKAEDLQTISGKKLRFEVLSGQNTRTEIMFAIRSRAEFLTNTVCFKDYNYRQPEVPLDIESVSTNRISGHGVNYIYGEHFKNLDDGQELIRIRQEALDCQRLTFVGESDCRGLIPGQRFELCEHKDPEFNREYLVLEVEHAANESFANTTGGNNIQMGYSNKVLLIPAGVPFRTPMQAARKIYGSFTAMVETTGGEYAYLDDQGRYRIRLPFDRGDANQGEASHPVRLAQPYSGKDYGFHFPLHADTEVIITCVNGDADRPIIIGAAHNPNTPSPVTEQNNTQNILRTWGDNELLMEDLKGKERIELFTKDKKNILTLDANSDGHMVRLATEEGKMEIYAAKTILTESGDTHTMESGNDHIVTVENSQKLMTKNKEIEYQAATDIIMKAGENIKMNAEKHDIQQHAKKNMIIKVGEAMSMEVQNKNMQIKVNSGDLSIQVAKAITIKGEMGGDIHIGQAGGSIEISTSGNIVVTGKSTVDITASNINIKGAQISNN